MFDSGISAAEIIADLQEEADIAIDIPNKLYVQWLNSVEQLLYSEIIKEQKVYDHVMLSVLPDESGSIKWSPMDIEFKYFMRGDNEAVPRFEDVYAVYAIVHSGRRHKQLIKTNVAGGEYTGYDDAYFKINDGMRVYNTDNTNSISIVYFVRPALKTADDDDNVSGGNVMVPVEFIDLVKSKLRGEAYKLANEDVLAAKWINDYNTLLENFKVWIAARTAALSM